MPSPSSRLPSPWYPTSFATEGPVEMERAYTDDDPQAILINGFDVLNWLEWAASNNLRVLLRLDVVRD